MKTEVIKDRMSGRILGCIDRYDNGDVLASLIRENAWRN